MRRKMDGREEEDNSSSSSSDSDTSFKRSRIQESVAQLQALVARSSRAVRNMRLRNNPSPQQPETSEVKLEGSDGNAAAKTDAVEDSTNGNGNGNGNAGASGSGGGGKTPTTVSVMIDLTMSSEGRGRGGEDNCRQQEATRPKLYIPSVTPIIPSANTYGQSSAAYNNRFYHHDEDHHLQGTKRKQPEEEERQYSPVNHHHHVIVEGQHNNTLVPLPKVKKLQLEKPPHAAPLMGLISREGGEASSIPAAGNEQQTSPTGNDNEERESSDPDPDPDSDPEIEEKYELPAMIPAPQEEEEEEEQRSPSSVPDPEEPLSPDDLSVSADEEEREDDDDDDDDEAPLVDLIGQNSSPPSPNYRKSKFVTSLHTRRVKTLTLSPVDDNLFLTSSLDGMVRLWEVHSRRLRVELLSASMDCVSPRKGRLAEDIAWHPNGDILFGVHNADGHDSQVSIMNLTGGNGEMREILVDFLENKPHAQGPINSIAFLPMEDQNVFVTGGSDHAVVVWREINNSSNNFNGFGEQNNKWMAEALHRTHHTGSVKGVCGLKHRHMVLSVGLDKRMLAFDVATGDKLFMHKFDTKCLDVLPNPCDSNLFLVQTGTHKRQIRLFDIRERHREIHDMGWRQQNSETQSGLINASWTSNGLFIACGSVEPLVNIFDIRYKGHKPILAVGGHEKRVYKAVCLRSRPLLISTSADHDFGLHYFA